MAPSTPPPPSRLELAALTIASASPSVVMSPWWRVMRLKRRERARGIEPPSVAWEATVLAIGQRPRGREILTGAGYAGHVRLAIGLLLAFVMAPAALAAQPQTTLPDVEDEVMCVECGTALNVSTSPVADREREFIRRRIAEGKSKPQIKAALVAEYGPTVLAVPEGGGFDVAAWLVPGSLCLLALLGIGAVALRWRGRPAAAEPGPAGPDLDPDDARRLDADMAAYDR